MRHKLPIILCLALLLAASAAQAKDFKSNTALESGYVWMFGYDDRASSIRMDPALCYGGTLFQIIDFDWSRNMIAEVNYLYSEIRGEAFEWKGGEIKRREELAEKLAVAKGAGANERRPTGPRAHVKHRDHRTGIHVAPARPRGRPLARVSEAADGL